MKNICKFIVLCCLTSGCQQVENRLEWLAGKRPPRNAITEAVYCYKTLGEINCYREPKKGWEARLVGHFEPPPPPPAPPPSVRSAAAADTVYEIKVEDVAKPEEKKPDAPEPKIKPLIKLD